jgi:hypothetical protein
MGIKAVMYTNDWCHACGAARQLIKDLPIEERDIEEHMDFCLSNGLTLVPTFVMLDGEAIVKKHVGFLEKEELLEFIKG